MQAALLILAIFLCNVIGCRKTETGPIYTGRLEIEGICQNYTLSVLNGGLDTTQVQARWTDPQTNITYTNAFGVSNPATFRTPCKQATLLNFASLLRIITVCNVRRSTPPQRKSFPFGP